MADAQHPATLVAVDSSVGYYPIGAIRKLTLGNGLTETAVYNNRLQPCRLNVNSTAGYYTQCTDAVLNGNVLDFTYAYNSGTANNGNVASWSATGNQGFNRTYIYDSLNRLQSMSAPGDRCTGLSWTYDAWGNRTDQTVTGGTCNTFHASAKSNNQLWDPVNNIYKYDAAGNMINDGTHSYTYDAENRLIQIDGGATATYAYDPDGRRAMKTVGSTTTNYAFDLGQNVLFETQGTSWLTAYIYFGGALKAQYKNGPTGTTNFLHHDHLGSTRLVTGMTSPTTPVDSLHYLPYGEQYGGDTATTHKFTGKERDSESSLDNFGARYYSSQYGRFMTPDPKAIDLHSGAGPKPIDEQTLADPQRLNLYAYARNNTLLYVDPDGKDVRVYTERLGWSSAGVASLLVPRHTFIRVTTPTKDVVIELGGPTKATAPKGDPIMKEVHSESDVTSGRKGVEEEKVTRPEDSPKGDFKFEDRIIQGFEDLKNNLPDYNHGLAPNSNGFAQFLIQTSGGSADLPANAYFQHDTQQYATPPVPQPPKPPCFGGVTTDSMGACK